MGGAVYTAAELARRCALADTIARSLPTEELEWLAGSSEFAERFPNIPGAPLTADALARLRHINQTDYRNLLATIDVLINRLNSLESRTVDPTRG